MLKRELTQTALNLVELGPRNKKRKDEQASSDDVKMSDGTANGDIQGDGESKEKVKQQGLELWHVIKDAVNKEGRILSEEFVHKPPKRQYADYYQIIEQPVFLDEIKKKLDSSEYQTFEGVKVDLELCFHNAKRYNQKDSQIWKDAKHLLKLVGKEYSRMVPAATGDGQVNVLDDGGDADGDGKKKVKTPSMSRLLKFRLTKLVEKADDAGRILSTEFMELPNKKLWPLYYKEIKSPQCLEAIFKHLKKREYSSSAEFAADVELVFSNAMHFNQDGTQIWEDARVLRNYFKDLMSDLPPPLALPQYAKPSGKIKIKMPQASGSRLSPTVSSAQIPASSSTHLRVPGGQNQATPSVAKAKSSPVPRPSALPAKVAAAVATTPLRPAPVPVQTQFIPTTSTTPQPQLQTQPISYMNATYSHHYPNASYQPPTTSTSGSTAHPTNYIPHNQSQASQSPAPPAVRPAHPLKGVSLKTEPLGRPFNLNHEEGVRTWVMRLGIGETAVSITDVRFLPVDDDNADGSGGEEDDHDDHDEDEGDDSAIEVEAPARNGRRKKRGRGRAKARAAALTTKAKLKTNARKSKAVLLPEDVQVKLDGSQVIAKEDTNEEWHVELPVGSHILEVGTKGGMVWKVFAEREHE